MRKKLTFLKCLLFFQLLFGAATYSQVTSTKLSIPTNNPPIPSSEAASLGRYGDIPVGLYSGVPNISIPIYDIKLKGMTIPIGLSYHAGGVKVDELASNLGLGWSLNYGGSATKATYGLDDLEDANGWFSSAHRLPQTGMLQVDNWNYGTYLTDSAYQFMKEMQEGELFDTQPDLYYLNINGRSVKFFFDHTGEIRTIPYSRLKIVPGGSGVTVTDENDVVYEFHESEQTVTHTQNTGSYYLSAIPASKSFAYYISKITTPNGETIDYTYESYSYTFNNQISETRYNYGPGGTEFLSPYCIPYLPANRLTTSYSDVFGKRIKKISSSSGVEINFSYNLSRTDLLGTNALTQVAVKSTIDNVVKLAYALSYDYDNDRLILKSVTKTGEQPHVFEYSSGLPNRLAKGSDHWGYINTSSYNAETTTLPIDELMNFTTGVVKTADENVTKGLLKKITYPTGGSTLFTYENNKVTNTGPSILKKIAGATAVANTTVTENFSINDQVPNSVRLTYDTPLGGSVYDPVTNTYGICNVKIKNSLGETVYTLLGTSGNPIGDLVTLPDGNYVIEIYTRYTSMDFDDAMVHLTWMEVGPVVDHVVNGPGARIKSITSNPVIGAGTTKHFEYTLASDTTKSSGSFSVSPIYISTLTSVNLDINNNVVTCDFWMQNAKSATAIGSMPGGGYGEVTVYEGARTNGYTHDFFDSPVQNQEYSLFVPQAPQIDNTWLTGQPIATHTYGYDEATTSYYLLNKTENIYKTVAGVGPNEYSSRGAVARIKRNGLVNDGSDVNNLIHTPAEYEVAYYRLYSSWTYPIKTINTTYKALDTNSKIRTETFFHYDNPGHIQLTRQHTNNSNGEQTMVRLSYPQDINPYYPYLSTPIVEKHIFTKNGSTTKLIDGELTTYKNQAGVFPEDYYSLQLAAPVDSALFAPYTGTVSPSYRQRVHYNYNGYNDVVSTLTDQVRAQGYKWGFGGKLLLAQATNALDNEIFYEGFEETGITGNSHTGSKRSNGAFTVNWTMPNTRNYVISYWYLDGTWKFRQVPYTGTSLVLTLGTAYDDIRIHPIDAEMITYSHVPLVGPSSTIDARSNIVYYEYDDNNRLNNIKDRNGDIVKSYSYNYANNLAQWTDLNIKRCVSVFGTYTGDEEKQQVDMNTSSSSYNQTRWVNIGNSGNCVQQNVYAKLELSESSNSSGGGYCDYYYATTANLYIKFFSDAACTIPVNLSAGLSVKVKVYFGYDDGSWPYNIDYVLTNGVGSGVSSYLVGSFDLERYQYACDESMTSRSLATSTYSFEVISNGAESYTPIN